MYRTFFTCEYAQQRQVSALGGSRCASQVKTLAETEMSESNA